MLSSHNRYDSIYLLNLILFTVHGQTVSGGRVTIAIVALVDGLGHRIAHWGLVDWSGDFHNWGIDLLGWGVGLNNNGWLILKLRRIVFQIHNWMVTYGSRVGGSLVRSMSAFIVSLLEEAMVRIVHQIDAAAITYWASAGVHVDISWV